MVFKLSNLRYKLNTKGTVLIAASLMMGALLLLGVYFLGFTLIETKIARSQSAGSQAYYLAEAGINKAIWKLKNEEPWKTCFTTSSVAYGCSCNNWQDSFVINLTTDSTTTVSVHNSACAQGLAIATSTLLTKDKKISQRVVKTTLYKALMGPTQNASLLTGGASQNVSITDSDLTVYGNFFVNNELLVKGASNVKVYDSSTTVETDGKILIAGNYNLMGGSVSGVAICASNICESTSTCNCLAEPDKFDTCGEGACQPKSIYAPAVDFDSISPNSFRSRAQAARNAGQCQILCNGSPCSNDCILTSSEFSSILNSTGIDGTTTLNNDITYITGGGVDLRCRRLVVNGELITTGAVNIGTSDFGCSGIDSQIMINRLTSTSTSGLLALGSITFGSHSFIVPTTLTGIIYAYTNNNKLTFDTLPQDVTIRGGIIGRKVDVNGVTNPLTIVLDNDVILYSLGYKINGVAIVPTFSPIITTDHWEESY